MEERTQVYLVHLQPKLKKLNIFTSKFYDEEDGEESVYSDGIEFAKIELVDVIMNYSPQKDPLKKYAPSEKQIIEEQNDSSGSDSESDLINTSQSLNVTMNSQTQEELVKQIYTPESQAIPQQNEKEPIMDVI